MVPKYTIKLDIGAKDENDKEQTESYVMDMDYTNLKRIQNEIEEALKAVDATYSKKVTKFLK